jgi:hypothetical protein
MEQAHLALDPLGRRRLLATEEGRVPPGGDRPERDGVHANAHRPVVDRQRAGQPFGRRLGRGVRQRSANGALRLVGGDIDDRAATGGQEATDRRRAPR